MQAIRTWWATWSPRQLRARVARLERAVVDRDDLQRKLAAQITEHHAWLAALVEVQQSNQGRYRELRRLYESRIAALRTRATAPPAVADDVPPAEEAA